MLASLSDYIDGWLARQQIQPRVVAEFDDLALMTNGIRSRVYNLVSGALPTLENQTGYPGTLPDNSVNATVDFGFVPAIEFTKILTSTEVTETGNSATQVAIGELVDDRVDEEHTEQAQRHEHDDDDHHGHRAANAEVGQEHGYLARDAAALHRVLVQHLQHKRDTVLQLARDEGLQVEEKRITRDEVYICDEAFFTGTAAEVTPIREVDGRVIGKGARGPITEKIQTAFFDIVNGRNPKYAEWLTKV